MLIREASVSRNCDSSTRTDHSSQPLAAVACYQPAGQGTTPRACTSGKEENWSVCALPKRRWLWQQCVAAKPWIFAHQRPVMAGVNHQLLTASAPKTSLLKNTESCFSASSARVFLLTPTWAEAWWLQKTGSVWPIQNSAITWSYRVGTVKCFKRIKNKIPALGKYRNQSYYCWDDDSESTSFSEGKSHGTQSDKAHS